MHYGAIQMRDYGPVAARTCSTSVGAENPGCWLGVDVKLDPAFGRRAVEKRKVSAGESTSEHPKVQAKAWLFSPTFCGTQVRSRTDRPPDLPQHNPKLERPPRKQQPITKYSTTSVDCLPARPTCTTVGLGLGLGLRRVEPAPLSLHCHPASPGDNSCGEDGQRGTKGWLIQTIKFLGFPVNLLAFPLASSLDRIRPASG